MGCVRLTSGWGGDDIGNQMAGFGGPGDAGAKDICKDTGGDGIVAVSVGPPPKHREA
jgi:hypothetical protein